MTLSREFTDPRLVAVYDTLNGYAPGTQPDFYLRVARECGARSVVEVGCGTGLITRLFVEQGYDVVGLDPSGPMLEIARSRPGAERVRWIEGGVGALDVRGADFAFMAGHVAQFLVSDDEWHAALRVLHAALRPGGRLAFESRSPAALTGEDWGRIRRGAGVEQWTEVTAIRGDVLHSHLCYRFTDTGEEIATDDDEFRFRSADVLHASLDRAGFTVEQTYGYWDRSPLTATSPEIITVAVAR